MKPEESVGCHQTLSARWGLGTRLGQTRHGNVLLYFLFFTSLRKTGSNNRLKDQYIYVTLALLQYTQVTVPPDNVSQGYR